MIDGKKIQNGMKACLDRRIDDKVERENMRDPLIAYTRAFDDAIDYFKQALWHDTSEEPEHSKFVLAQRKTFIGELRYYLYETNSTYPWELNVRDLRIIKWCYIEDILPKGGEK